MMGLARLWAGMVWLLVTAACAVVPAPSRPLSPSLLDRPETVLEGLAARESAVTTVRGLASVRYDGPAGSGSATQVIVAALPDRGRVEVLSPLGTAVLLVVIRGQDVAVHAPARHEYGAGRATPETLGRLAQVPIPPGQLLRLLVGLPPLPVRAGDPRVRVTAEAEAVRVESVDGPYWQRMWTGPDGAEVERGELGEATGPLLRFEFGERRRMNGAALPLAIRLEGVRTGTRVAIQYETARLNEPVDAGLFDLPPPADGRTRILDLGGGTLPEPTVSPSH